MNWKVIFSNKCKCKMILVETVPGIRRGHGGEQWRGRRIQI
jgi:hypothetical protein